MYFFGSHIHADCIWADCRNEKYFQIGGGHTLSLDPTPGRPISQHKFGSSDISLHLATSCVHITGSWFLYIPGTYVHSTACVCVYVSQTFENTIFNKGMMDHCISYSVYGPCVVGINEPYCILCSYDAY